MGNLLKRFADTRYHYDAHGNLTRSITVGGSTWEYRYDAEHRLVEACQYAQAPAAGDSVKARTKAEYGYDALGRRVWKQVEIDGQAPELTVFTWDGDLLQSETRFEGDIHQPVRSRPPGLIPENPRRKFPRPIAQQVHTLDASDLVPTHTATYLYEPDSFIPLAQLTAGFDHTALAATGTDRQPLRCYQTQTATLYYFQTDHLGTPQDITDTEGRIVWSGQYRAWGQLAQTHNGQGEKAHIHNPFRFQGQYHDRETGLHYNRFRYYDPRIGRFTTQDPIGLMGGENLYQYAPNPTGWIDPLGLSKCGCSDIPKATDLPVIRPGTPEWKTTVNNMEDLGKGKLNVRTETATEAHTLLREGRGNMNRYRNYTDKNYNKGYETHNIQNSRELDSNNDLQHLKWKDGKSGGHIYYNQPN